MSEVMDMKFNVYGVRTRTITTVITEVLCDCEIDVTKAEVMRITDCPAKIDGDSTGWYGEVEQALQWGAEAKVTKGQERELADVLDGDRDVIDSLDAETFHQMYRDDELDFNSKTCGFAIVEESSTEKQEWEIDSVEWS